MPIIARDPKDPRSAKWLAEAREIIGDLDQDGLTDWELEFIDDIENKWIPEGRITERQLQVLRRIADPDVARRDDEEECINFHREYDD